MYKCLYCGKQYASAKDVSACYYKDLVKEENDKSKKEEIKKKIDEINEKINQLKKEKEELEKQLPPIVKTGVASFWFLD